MNRVSSHIYFSSSRVVVGKKKLQFEITQGWHVVYGSRGGIEGASYVFLATFFYEMVSANYTALVAH